jgi:hypothetical protein
VITQNGEAKAVLQDVESIRDCVSESHRVAADGRRDMPSLLARRLLGA